MQGICQLCHKVSIFFSNMEKPTVSNGFDKIVKTTRANCTFSKEFKGF